MYILTSKEPELTPIPYSTFAGTLGQVSFPPSVQDFLNQVRKDPQAFRSLLLTVRFDPNPELSQEPNLSKLWNLVVSSKVSKRDAVYSMVLGELNQILNTSLLKNSQLRQQVEIEAKLRDQLINTTADLGLSKLEPFMLKALAIDLVILNPKDVGFDFAKTMLPGPLFNRIQKSPIADAHFNRLGQLLREFAEERRKRNPAFKQRIEEKKQKQQKKKRRQMRRYRY
jgi:hypothetical protein